MQGGGSAGERDSSDSQLPLRAAETHGFGKIWFPRYRTPLFQGVRSSPAWALLISLFSGEAHETWRARSLGGSALSYLVPPSSPVNDNVKDSMCVPKGRTNTAY